MEIKETKIEAPIIDKERLMFYIFEAIENEPDLYPEVVKVAGLAWTRYKKMHDSNLAHMWLVCKSISKKEREKLAKRINRDMFPKELIECLDS